MRVKSLSVFAVLLSAFAVLLSLTATIFGQGSGTGNEPSAAGLWQAVDDQTQKPTAWFLIRDNDGVYTGIIAKMFLKPGERPDEPCSHCPGDRHNHPWLGLEIIRGMKRNGLNYEGGSILDPRDGDVYDAVMALSPDGQTLTVRGYLGISLLGKNQYWTRLPDSDYKELDPSVNPGANPGAKDGSRL
jgi:uncharacterized protein (DUF2147 family)